MDVESARIMDGEEMEKVFLAALEWTTTTHRARRMYAMVLR